MAKLNFNDYAHDRYERSETVERLVHQFDWDEADAERYAENHAPMYEVEGRFEYDTETGKLRVLGAKIEGVDLFPIEGIRIDDQTLDEIRDAVDFARLHGWDG